MIKDTTAKSTGGSFIYIDKGTMGGDFKVLEAKKLHRETQRRHRVKIWQTSVEICVYSDFLCVYFKINVVSYGDFAPPHCKLHSPVQTFISRILF